MPSRQLWILVFSLSLTLILCPFVQSQSTYGSITGSVSDATGAAVAGAQVTLTNIGTSEKRTQTTGTDGLYSFVNLIPGDYRVDIEKEGFKHFGHPSVVVQVNQSSKIDAVLAVGQVSETVEVTSETPLLQTETSSLGQVVEQRKANELPLNGRNVFNLITISPAAVAQGGAGGTPVGQNPFSWGNYQVGGSFANEGAQYLDGQPLNIGYINLPIIIPIQDSVGEFKVQYNNLGAEWGKFAGGVVNLSTKSGSNLWHGEAYEYLRNKALNAKGYFDKGVPPYVQNQYGINGGGPILKDKLFVFGAWEQFRLRQGKTYTGTVPLPKMMTTGDFSSLLALPTPIQLYDPYTVDTSGTSSTNPNYGNRKAYANNQIPANEFNPAAAAMYSKLYPAPTNPNAVIDNFSKSYSTGGNTNQFLVRSDWNISGKSRLFGRFTYNGLLDLPTDPYGTGLCQDRCSENYHTKALVIDYNRAFTPNVIFDFNVSGSRFVYARAPINSAYDLTQLGWPGTYNAPPPAMRTPPTPAFSFNNDIGHSQGQSFIQDFNTQYNVSPSVNWIRGKHTFQFGAQWELGLDNYAQTNIASGAFAFSGAWTANNGLVSAPNTGFGFADFLLGLSQNQGSFVNQTEGVAQVPAQTAGKQVYRAFYFNDNWHVTSKLTLNLGLRYDLQGTWSERFNRMTYWDPQAVNATVTGCGGTAGTPCTGDAFLVKSGRNTSANNLPLDKKEFSPRLGFAYSFDSKTVIRAGYGIFWIPNYVSFGVNPDLDVVSLATTPFTATTNAGLTPSATLNSTGCSLPVSATNTFASFNCTANQGPFGADGISLPPGRNAQPSTSAFVAATGSPTLAPYFNPKEGYVQQWNLNIQRELPAGFFIDAAYAGSHGVHLPQFSTHVNQIADSFIQAAAAQFAAGTPVAIAQQVANPMAGTSPNTTIGGATIVAGQLVRPYPQYTDLNLAGYGCCGSSYNSLQVTATRRFQGGGTLLVAYTNAKLLSNTDTLTSWLEGDTGGVGQVQDWNNLARERSLSSQDVSQRVVISYVLDLPFGRGKKWANDFTGFKNGLVSGWGIDGVTLFQKGFPVKITWAGSGTALEKANLGVSNVRPDVVAGCSKGSHPTGKAQLTKWFNTSCFTDPPQWGFGTEARVDSSIRMDGAANFDFALFKRTQFGPDGRLGLEFRTEFFNLFNTPQFAAPSSGLGSGNFGQVTATVGNPRLIQFGLKFAF